MKIIIGGAGEVGSHLAKMLSSESNDITVIDNNEQRLNSVRESTDVITVEGNPSSIEVLKYAEAEKADLFIAVFPSESQDVNIVSAVLAKKLGAKKVTARIDNEEYLSTDNKILFTEMGIDLLFYPEKIAANEIVDLLKRTASTESMDFTRGKLQMAVFKLEEDSPLIEKRLQEFSESFSTDYNSKFRVVAISRNNETIMPRFDTRFRYHDLVFIIALKEGIQKLMEYMGKEDIEVNKLMILGGGKIGRMVAEQMKKETDVIKIIDMDMDKCMALSGHFKDNILVINGDGRNSDLLLDEQIKDFDAFVAVTNSTETNILACVAAKRMGVGRTIAEVENLEYIRLAESMGVDAVINKKLITAGRIFKFTLSSTVRFIKYMSGTNAEVIEYIVGHGAKISKAPLKDLGFPSGAIIGGVIRGSDSFIAVGDTQIKVYDRVVVFAAPSAVKEVDKFFRAPKQNKNEEPDEQ